MGQKWERAMGAQPAKWEPSVAGSHGGDLVRHGRAGGLTPAARITTRHSADRRARPRRDRLVARRPASAPGLRAPTLRCMIISVVSGVEPWTRLRILEDLTRRLVSSEEYPHRPETKHSAQCPRRLLTLKWERFWSRFLACVEVSEGSRQWRKAV
jgi:hypothetical protein